MSLQAYIMNDYRILVPSGFRDRSINMLEWSTEEGDKVAVIVQRERLPEPQAEESPAEQLHKLVDRETRDYPARFVGYHVEHDEVAVVGAYTAHRKSFRWMHEADVMYHHQVFALVDGGVALFTGAGKARHRESIDRMLADIVAELHVREVAP